MTGIHFFSTLHFILTFSKLLSGKFASFLGACLVFAFLSCQQKTHSNIHHLHFHFELFSDLSSLIFIFIYSKTLLLILEFKTINNNIDVYYGNIVLGHYIYIQSFNQTDMSLPFNFPLSFFIYL